MARFKDESEPKTITPLQALQGARWAVAFDYGTSPVVYETFRTRANADRRCRELNRKREERHAGGVPYEVRRIDYTHTEEEA